MILEMSFISYIPLPSTTTVIIIYINVLGSFIKLKYRGWKQFFRIMVFKRFLSPHLVLILACALYMIFGAFIFQFCEGPNFDSQKENNLALIGRLEEDYINKLSQNINDHINTTKRFEKKFNFLKNSNILNRYIIHDIVKNNKNQFDQLVDAIFSAHRTSRHGFDKDSPTWDFKNSLFFTATMLTSIGYGFVAPSTFMGRLFVVIYCLIGIPLTLVTVANVAKFISETVFVCHYELWKMWMRFKNRKKGRGTEDEIKELFGESEDEQEILDRVRLIRFPPIVVFMFVFIYGLFGAYIVKINETSWTYSESLYFTFISITTVGFGDYRPKRENLYIVLIVVMGGIMLTTMCMDVVGRMYLKEIHYIGRKLQTNNPFYLIREAKARRRRAAMASLLAQLARGMIFAHRDYSELSRKKSKKKVQKKRPSYVLPDGKFMFARQPPDSPRECQVISTSAYSVRLAWAPAFSADEKVHYNVKYRLKYSRQKEESKVRELKGIEGNSAEIMSIESCSLYEFRITAVSRYGESKPVYLVQYTEPQLSPQHILATKIAPNSVELTWEPPYKKSNNVKHYMVYWTDNPSARLSDWQKVEVHGRKVVFPELKYDWFYMFCANTCFKDGQRSPLSRSLFIKTDKLEFHNFCVGHSQTIDITEALSKNDVVNENTPLIKRDYASFVV
uniref:Fibronectin type-III domain-containing protein n=1 Tax=Strongyloides stercoralis TaxID=6248 RepID=A0A0K0DT04_STRER